MAETEAAPQRPDIYLLHDGSLEPSVMDELNALEAVPWVEFTERNSIAQGARVLLYLGDERIRELAELAMGAQWEVGVLPHPEARQACTTLGVKGSLTQVFEHYLHCKPIHADAFLCNDELVFSSVVIGRVLALRPRDINQPQTTWSLVRGALKGLSKLSLKGYRLVTGKEREVRMAALGMVALTHTQSALVDRAFSDELPIADGRLTLLALAPRSIGSYLLFLLRLLLPGRINLSRLPPSLSLIQTDNLHISAPSGTEYLLDGKPVHTSELELKVLKLGLCLLPGPAMKKQREIGTPSGKETVKLNHVPVGEGAGALLDHQLPLFDHATEDEYRELFVTLRDSAQVTSSLKVLMVLSVLLAAAGMYANSAPVIIGAMILAPLMSPIVSLAMGLARTDPVLTRLSLKAVAVGVGWGLATAMLVAWAMPLEIPTTEMKARMSPTLLDLIVAVVSGVAGAYAFAKEEVAKSLAGVAIAVALVPPLSVVGIGLGWGDLGMAGGAFLLLATNLVGIALAAAATFLVLGFAPFHRARAGIGLTLAMLLVLAIPLTLSFSHLVDKQRIQSQVPRGELLLGGMNVHISKVDVTLSEPHLVRIVLSSEKPLQAAHVDELKRIVTREVEEAVLLEVQSNIRR